MRCHTIFLICALVLVVAPKSTALTACGPVCAIFCQYGNVLDARGCPTCACKKSPCRGGQAPLEGYFCGRGPNRKDCPSTHQCVIAPTDAYAVCCPRCKQVVTTPAKAIEKPGSCPILTPTIDIVKAGCSDDNDCEGTLKCCGSSPRTCVYPVLVNVLETA